MQQPANNVGPNVTPETTQTVERRDRWSLWLLALAVLAVILVWWSLIASASMLPTLYVVFAAAVTLGVAAIAMLVHVVTRRGRAALSALAAVAIVVGGFAVRLSVRDAARYVDFAIHRAGYERIVAASRAKNPGSLPFRLVLEVVDRSTFIAPAIFDYIVYDESDAVGRDPSVLASTWACAIPGNDVTTITGGTIVVRPFGGHFYFVEQTL
jgi:hypothetical protein